LISTMRILVIKNAVVDINNWGLKAKSARHIVYFTF
jgi:hypothetical protein